MHCKYSGITKSKSVQMTELRKQLFSMFCSARIMELIGITVMQPSEYQKKYLTVIGVLYCVVLQEVHRASSLQRK